MTKKTIHIVCFDVPYPVSHGGFFDLYYKLVALHQQGINIYLHCFEYGRERQEELNQYCKKVFYYKRTTGMKGFSLTLPYIVSSRINSALFKNLSADSYPILLEGTHCTYYLYKNAFPNRTVIYRLHNVEHTYYYQLFLSETSLLKKLYYWYESRQLRKYEKSAAANASIVLAVSETDKQQFESYTNQKNVTYLPLFLPFSAVDSKPGKGDYCLYHGNLSVAENERSVLWLIGQMQHTEIAFIVAGRNPSTKLKKMIRRYKNVELIENPTQKKMEELIANAHINLIYSFNKTGIKIKLLHALFFGRHCIANMPAITNQLFSETCHIANSGEELLQTIHRLANVPFSEDHKALRERLLLPHFNNTNNAVKLSELL